jgi:hypothetical protein
MIDPNNVINYTRTKPQLEEFILFCIFVANKPAAQTAKKLDLFLEYSFTDPFKYISHIVGMEDYMSYFIIIK